MTTRSRNAVRFEASERTATLTLAQPEKRNPISEPEVVAEIVEAIARVQAAPKISVLIITGEGPAFSAGGDIKAMHQGRGISAGTPMEVAENYRASVQRIPLALHGLDAATIAAVNGPAIGAGCDLAMMCDIRVASTRARFGETFLNLGLIPGDGGAWFLPRVVGYQRAAELTFTGRLVDAEEAARIGMVLKVVEPAALMAEARRLAEEIAAKPPAALRLAKRLLRHATHMPLPEFLDACAAYQALAHHGAEHKQALENFFADRPAKPNGE